VSVGKNPAFAGLPMVFMYVTTIAAAGVTAFNLYQSIIAPGEVGGVPVIGAWAMIFVAALLIVAALVIAADGIRSYGRFRREPVGEAAPGTPAAAPRA
jgi:hypothetical protein